MHGSRSLSIVALSLLAALPAYGGTPRQHPRVTAAPRIAVKAEMINGSGATERVNSGYATTSGPLMLNINGYDLRIHGLRVPSEARVKYSTVQGHLDNLIDGKEIKCLTIGIDVDGVPLVACEGPGITNLALKMLQSGFADVDSRQVAGTPVAALYTQTARMAREQKIGIWSGRNAAPVRSSSAQSRTTPPINPPATKPVLTETITPQPDSAPVSPQTNPDNLDLPNPQEVVKSISFPAIGLKQDMAPLTPTTAQDHPDTVDDQTTVNADTAAMHMSQWMMQKLGQDADPLGADAPAAVTSQATTGDIMPPMLRDASQDITPSTEPRARGGMIVLIGLLLTGAAAIGGYFSWKKQKTMLEELAHRHRMQSDMKRRKENLAARAQKMAINLEEDLLSLSQMLSSRSDIARLTANGPGGDTASDLKSLTIHIPMLIAKPEQAATRINQDMARQLRKITNAVMELDARINQCVELAQEGRLRDRPPALFMALSRRMDVIAADARSLSISLRQNSGDDQAVDDMTMSEPVLGPEIDWALSHSDNSRSPESKSPRRSRDNTKSGFRKAPVLQRPALSTRRRDGGSWGQPDWASA